MKSKKTIRFRVECNYGSRYFEIGTDAYSYFREIVRDFDGYAQLWVVLTEKSSKDFSMKQELIAYSEVNILKNQDC